jgi:RNA polymerase sigma factor (sigma-70 family)
MHFAPEGLMSLKEANQLIKKYIRLREKSQKSKDHKLVTEFRAHENLCIQKFKYLVLMKTSRYKNFSNYEDLNQEGLEALLKAMNSYDPKKGSWFWWAHKYIDTRIARCANLHTTIRFPLKYAKQVAPHRESVLPILVDQVSGPYDILERNEMLKTVKKNFAYLSPNQQKVVTMLFGMDGEAPQSISKVCQKLRMSRPNCVKLLDQVLNILRRNVQL